MRQRAVVRVVDALAAQQRLIIWLECKHTVSLTQRDLEAGPPSLYAAAKHATHWPCTHCADAPPEQTVRQTRMAREYDSLAD